MIYTNVDVDIHKCRYDIHKFRYDIYTNVDVDIQNVGIHKCRYTQKQM